MDLGRVTKIRRVMFAGASRALALLDACIIRLTRASRFVRYQSYLRLFFRPRSDDIFVVSYPKAGTTVMQLIVHHVVGRGNVMFDHIETVAPWFEVTYASDPAHYDTLPSPRIFKTHLTLTRLPSDASYIYLYRNPKDTCVSFYYHLMSAAPEVLPLQPFVEQFTRGELGAGSWFKHFESCLRGPRRARVLLVNFEEIASDLGAVIDRVSAFCGRQLTVDERAKAIAHCHFDAMKQDNNKFDPRFAPSPQARRRTDFIRKGKSGDWVHHLTPAQALLIDQEFDNTLQKVGPILSAPYVMVIQPAASNVRGTLAVEIGLLRQNRLLLWQDRAVAQPWGVRTLLNGQPLSVGHMVRLELSAGDGTQIASVDRAEVVSITNGVMDLRIARIGAADSEKLRAYCSLADEHVTVRAPCMNAKVPV